MVAPVIVGVLGLAGLWTTATIISHLIFPISVIGAFITFFATYRLVGYVQVVQLFSKEWMNQAIRFGIALVMGVVAYRAFVWVLAGAGLLTLGLVVLLLVTVGPSALWAFVELWMGMEGN